MSDEAPSSLSTHSGEEDTSSLTGGAAHPPQHQHAAANDSLSSAFQTFLRQDCGRTRPLGRCVSCVSTVRNVCRASIWTATSQSTREPARLPTRRTYRIIWSLGHPRTRNACDSLRKPPFATSFVSIAFCGMLDNRIRSNTPWMAAPLPKRKCPKFPRF